MIYYLSLLSDLNEYLVCSCCCRNVLLIVLTRDEEEAIPEATKTEADITIGVDTVILCETPDTLTMKDLGATLAAEAAEVTSLLAGPLWVTIARRQPTPAGGIGEQRMQPSFMLCVERFLMVGYWAYLNTRQIYRFYT